MQARIWSVRPAAPDSYARTLAGSFSPEVIQLLWNRGVREEEAAAFTGRQRREVFDDIELGGVGEASSRIERAIASAESIAVHGDYDADGIAGAAIMAGVLEDLGANFRTFLPSRQEHGYDISQSSVERFHSEGVKLIVTVDCGITAHSAIRRARELGIDVIVTDHHLPGHETIEANIVVNPKCELPGGPYDQLSGSGVAYMLSRTIRKRAGSDPDIGLDLAAIGTIADVMPLTGINRDIVSLGLTQIRRLPRVGIEALRQTARLADIGAQSVAFSIVPRINAAGRIHTPDPAFRLLTTQDPTEAAGLANMLDRLNAERQRRSAELVNQARLQLERPEKEVGPVLIRLQSPDTGLFGLVAGQLARELYRQVFVVDETSAVGTGSARSGDGGSVYQTLERCGDLLVRYGGHSVAAGFSVARDNLEAFSIRLREVDDGPAAPPPLLIEGELSIDRVGSELIREIALLEPFGNGNPEPLFLSKYAFVEDARTVGRQGEHIQLVLRKGKSSIRAIGFGLAGRLPVRGDRVDVVSSPFVDSWQGRENPRLRIEDLRPAVLD